MKPKTLSATAIQTANLCLSRFEAEHIIRGRGPSGQAALLGTSVHDALEIYVQGCYLDKNQTPSLKLLLDLFHLSYMKTFGTGETDTEDFSDGTEMLKAWFKRTDFDQFSVVSAEVKENFPIKTSIGTIPFNFIWDRHDRLSDTEVRVVDYKTNRWPYSPQDLLKLPQARAYGLAANIKYPDAERIWVEFDMLRHQGPVGVSFTREDNYATYRWLKREAERIIATPDGKAPETINAQCNFCVKKTTCGAYKRHVQAGGVLSFTNAAEAIQKRAELEYAKKMVTNALAELDEFIMEESKQKDIFEWETDDLVMEVVIGRGFRQIDADRAARVLGPDLMSQYAGVKMTMASVDKLLKGNEITDEQKKQLRSLISTPPGNPRISVKPKSQFEED